MEEILGVMNVNGHKIKVNDMINPFPQLTKGQSYGDFVINEVVRRLLHNGRSL